MAGLMGARAFKPDATSMGEAYAKRPRVATRKRNGIMRLENIVKIGLRVVKVDDEWGENCQVVLGVILAFVWTFYIYLHGSSGQGSSAS